VVTNIGRAILNSLSQAVRGDWWEEEDAVDKPLYWNSESGTPNVVNLDNYSIDGIDYENSSYEVTGFQDHDYRQAEVTINYPTD